jgi:lysozyme
MTAIHVAGGVTSVDIGVAIDIETDDGRTGQEVRSGLVTWLGAIERQTRRSPIVYTNAAMASVLGSEFGAYPLWVANWGNACPTMPQGWSGWQFWQFSNVGVVRGVSGLVDLDEFDGTADDLRAWWTTGPTAVAAQAQGDEGGAGGCSK